VSHVERQRRKSHPTLLSPDLSGEGREFNQLLKSLEDVTAIYIQVFSQADALFKCP